MAASTDLTKLTAREAVRLLDLGDVSPLELIDAAAARIAATSASAGQGINYQDLNKLLQFIWLLSPSEQAKVRGLRRERVRER